MEALIYIRVSGQALDECGMRLSRISLFSMALKGGIVGIGSGPPGSLKKKRTS